MRTLPLVPEPEKLVFTIPITIVVIDIIIIISVCRLTLLPFRVYLSGHLSPYVCLQICLSV
jgi:hypothetical protein